MQESPNKKNIYMDHINFLMVKIAWNQFSLL